MNYKELSYNEMDNFAGKASSRSKSIASNQVILERYDTPAIHRESFFLEYTTLFIACSGICEFVMSTDGKTMRTYLLDQGKVIIVPRKLLISSVSVKTAGQLFSVGFSHAYFNRIASDLKIYDFDSVDLEFREDELSFRLAEQLSNEDTIDSIAYAEILSQSLASHIIDCQTNKRQYHYTRKAGRTPGSRVIISSVIKFIHDNTNLPLKVSEVATALGYRRSSLDSKFRKEMGISVHDYIASCKMNKAKLLLSDESLTIAAIAEMTGFFDHSHFSSVFKEHFGISPSDFRMSITKNFAPDKKRSSDDLQNPRANGETL